MSDTHGMLQAAPHLLHSLRRKVCGKVIGTKPTFRLNSKLEFEFAEKETVLGILNSVFKGSRADVGADVGLVPGRRGCGRGFCVLGAIGVGQKTTVEGFTRVRVSRRPCFRLFASLEVAFAARFRGQQSTIGP